MTSRFVGVVVPTGKPSTSSAHALGSAIADSVVVWAPARWAMNAGPIGPRHCAALCRTGATTSRLACSSRSTAYTAPSTWARSVPVLSRSKLEIVAVAHHPVPAAGEPVAVDLEPVPQARLHDPVAALDLVDQAVDVGMQLVVDAGDVPATTAPSNSPPKPGAGSTGRTRWPSDSRRVGHGGARVPHLELGEQHAGVYLERKMTAR